MLWHIIDLDEPALLSFKQSLYVDGDGRDHLIDCSDRKLCVICNYVDECEAYS